MNRGAAAAGAAEAAAGSDRLVLERIQQGRISRDGKSALFVSVAFFSLSKNAGQYSRALFMR